MTDLINLRAGIVQSRSAPLAPEALADPLRSLHHDISSALSVGICYTVRGLCYRRLEDSIWAQLLGLVE